MSDLPSSQDPRCDSSSDPRCDSSSDSNCESIELRMQHWRVRYHRFKTGVHVVRIEGSEGAALTLEPFKRFERRLIASAPVDLFIDMRKAPGAAINLAEWISFIGAGRRLFKQVHVLAASPAASLSVTIIKHLSQTGELIRLHTDALAYNRHLHHALRTM